MSPASPSCQSPGFVPVPVDSPLCVLTHQLAPRNPKMQQLSQLSNGQLLSHSGDLQRLLGLPGFAYHYLHPPAGQVQREKGCTHLCVTTDALDLWGPGSRLADGRLDGQY